MGDHRIERAIERYAIPFTKYDLAACERRISEGHALVVEKQREGCKVVVVNHRSIPMICVTAANGAIMTFLPPNALQKGVRAAHYRKSQKLKRRMKRREVLAALV